MAGPGARLRPSPSVATISNALGQNGLATSTGSGSTTITVTLRGVSATITLTVTVTTPPGPPLLSIAVTPSSPTTDSGTALQMTARGTYSDGSRQNITSRAGSSSNTSAATVSAAGLATAVAPGTANISQRRRCQWSQASNCAVEPPSCSPGATNTARGSSSLN